MNRATGCMAVVLAVVAALWPSAPAAAVVISDVNSSVTFSPTTSAGISSWQVDGAEQLKQQWFWYRVGSSGAEQALNTLTLDASTTSATGTGSTPDTLYLRYLGSGFKVELTFLVRGGQAGSKTADMTGTINVTNLGSSALDFHFFQYADFDISTGADTIQITGGNTAHQSAATGHISEVIATPMPSHHAAGLLTDSPSILGRLTDASATTLGDADGPAFGDAAWAFQWDSTISAGGVLSISKAMSITPEPATLALLGAGLVFGLLKKRRG